MKIILVILGISVIMLSGCASIAIQERLIDGELTITERLTLKGMKSTKKAKFSDKSEISDKSGLSGLFPDINIDLDKLQN